MLGLLFTYALTYGGAVVALFRPFYGLLIYISFAELKPESLWPWSVPEGNYSRIIALALLAGWAVQGFGNWRFERAKPIVAILIAYFLWVLFGIYFAFDKEVALAYCDGLFKIVLPFLVGITTIDSLRKLKQLAWVLVLSEGFLAYEFNVSYFSGYNRLWLDGFGNMDNNCNAIALVTCVGLAFFLGFHVKQWWLKVGVLGIWLCLVHAILFSFSRGGMLALLITMGISFLLIPKRPQHYVGFLIAIAVIVRLAGPGVLDRFESTFASEEQRDESAASRLQLWTACWASMKEHPLGVGPGHWPLIADQYGFPKGKEAHSLWMQIGAEMGFPGVGLLLCFYGLTMFRLWPLTRDKTMVPDPWFRYLARMVVASLVGFCISAQFVSLYGLEHPYYIALIGAGLLKLRHRAGTSAEVEPASVPASTPHELLMVGGTFPRFVRGVEPSAVELAPLRAAVLPTVVTSSSDVPLLFLGVPTPPSRLFSVRTHHPILGEYELPLDTADWTVVNEEGMAVVEEGRIIGKKPGKVILRATVTLGDGTRQETGELVAYVQNIVAETVWIETAKRR